MDIAVGIGTLLALAVFVILEVISHLRWRELSNVLHRIEHDIADVDDAVNGDTPET